MGNQVIIGYEGHEGSLSVSRVARDYHNGYQRSSEVIMGHELRGGNDILGSGTDGENPGNLIISY